MAHSVAESLSPENAKHYIKVGSESWPATEWEKFCSIKRALKLLKGTENLISLVEEKSSIEKIPRFILSEFAEI